MLSLIAKPYYFTGDVFPNFQKPKIVGYFSLDGKRTYRSDASQLKFMPTGRPQQVDYDLGHNLARVIRKGGTVGTDEKLTNLLKFFLQSENRLYNKNPNETNTLDAALFHCYRGLLTLIAASPYEKDPWRILATLYRGKIYMYALETDQQKERNSNLTERDLMFMSWGFKFEQYMLADYPNGKPDISLPVDENEEFTVVFTTRLGSHRILYGAEMDGIRADGAHLPDINDVGEDGFIEYLSQHEFIELKTSRQIETSKQHHIFKRYKLIKWWLQSFLVGISTVVCGFRDDYGQVRDVAYYNVQEMPKIAAGTWKPNVCFSFCDKFLTFVKESFAREITSRYGNSRCDNLSEIPGAISIHFECREDGEVVITNDYNASDKILPEWFLSNKTQAI